MNKNIFEKYMSFAKVQPGDYYKGYQKGLRRLYHGEKFGTVEDHKKHMAMADHRQEMGEGYRAGFSGEPPKGLHGMTGHQNAMKGEEPASSILTVRVTPTQKALWVKAAQKEGLKLSEWVIKTLNGETIILPIGLDDESEKRVS